PLNAYAGTGKPTAEIAARYRAHAAACVRFAQTIPDIGGKLSLLDMAGRWLALAEEIEKNDGFVSSEAQPRRSRKSRSTASLLAVLRGLCLADARRLRQAATLPPNQSASPGLKAR